MSAALRAGHLSRTLQVLCLPLRPTGALLRINPRAAAGWNRDRLTRRFLGSAASVLLFAGLGSRFSGAHTQAAPVMAALADLDLGTAAGRLQAFQSITEEVYGHYTPGQPWRPRPYEEEKGRYLWTDAFGVVNYITLACETGDPKYLDQADVLIREVHDTLGRDRRGRRRLGGATDAEPTRGGLRIGKKHEEGHPDGDGQYFHYLTKWAFALNRMSLARGDKKYNTWAVQLMQAAHPHFVAGRGTARPRMFWKVSIDMLRPVVNSEGNLDPFDGLVTYRLLREAAGGGEVLREEIADMERMVANKYQRYHSDDALDLGEALWLSHWGLADSGGGGGSPELDRDEEWAALVSQRSAAALGQLWAEGYFSEPARYRLAFREFGTTLGVQVNPRAGPEWAERVAQLHRFWASGGQLFHRDRDITPVMLCASLVPGAWRRDYTEQLVGLGRHSEL